MQPTMYYIVTQHHKTAISIYLIYRWSLVYYFVMQFYSSLKANFAVKFEILTAVIVYRHMPELVT
jgi:hypothetical protein